MAHRHLVLAYVLTWVLQLGYLGFLGLKWQREKRAGRSVALSRLVPRLLARLAARWAG